MFNFFHPKPVNDPRPVVVQMVQTSARPAALPAEWVAATVTPQQPAAEQPPVPPR